MKTRWDDLPRREVVSGYQTDPWWANTYNVTLSCGHTAVARGYKGQLPRTSGCYQCYQESKDAKQ